jgi:hypothetical protein
MEWKWNPKNINYLTNMCQSGQGTAVILFPLTATYNKYNTFNPALGKSMI